MSHKSRNPRLHRRLGLRKEFPQGFFNGVLRGFDPTTGYYRVKYEDGDREEMSEDEVFSTARAFRDHYRHTDVPKITIRRKFAKSVQSPVHAIPADEGASSLVVVAALDTSRVRNERFIKLCGGIFQLWGFVHLLYTFVAWIVGRN